MFMIRVTTPPNTPDAANPALTLWLTIDGLWRRVADLERWADSAHHE